MRVSETKAPEGAGKRIGKALLTAAISLPLVVALGMPMALPGTATAKGKQYEKPAVPTLELKVKAAGSGYVESALADTADEIMYRAEVSIPAGAPKTGPYPLTVKLALPNSVTWTGYCDAESEGAAQEESQPSPTDALTMQKANAAEGDEKGSKAAGKGWSVKKEDEGIVWETVDAYALDAEPGGTVTVYFGGELGKNATLGADKPNTARAIAGYDDTAGNKGKTVEDTADVVTVKVSVEKTGADNKALAGAELALLDANGRSASSDGTWKTGSTTTVKTGNDGIAKMGQAGPGTYTLKETTAPKGYKKASDTTVKLSTLSGTDSEPELKVEVSGPAKLKNVDIAKGEVVLQLSDEKEAESKSAETTRTQQNTTSASPAATQTASGKPLPITGDNAALVAALLAAIAAAACAAYAIASRRKKAKEEEKGA